MNFLNNFGYRSDIAGLIYVKNTKCKQVSTHAHVGKLNHQDWVFIEPNSFYFLPEIKGPGVINCIWITMAPNKAYQSFNWYLRSSAKLDMLRKVKIRIQFDDEKEPRVEAPVGDFFGSGFSEYKKWQARSAYVGMTSGGFYCYFPMPFAKNCKIEFINTNKKVKITLYGSVTYQQIPEFTDNLLYFNAKFHQENPTTKNEPYILLENNKGPGHYVGCILNMKRKGWKWIWNPIAYILSIFLGQFDFMEGNLKVWIDDEEREGEPSIEYTGTEDYFMGAWYFMKGEFSHLYHGLTSMSKLKRQISAYRFHPEGIPYKNSIRVTIHHGEFDEVKADYSSVTYWYSK